MWTHTETLRAETQVHVEKTIRDSITEITGGSTSIGEDPGFELSFAGEFLGFSIAPVTTNVVETFKWENSKTHEITHKVASIWTQEIEISNTLQFSSESQFGYYRYVQYAKRCEVYALVIYNNASGKFDYNYISFVDSNVKNRIDLIEYSPNGDFDSDHETSLVFDKSLADKIDVNKTLEYRGKTDIVNTILIPIKKENCALDKGYDPDTECNEESKKEAHNGFEVGQVEMNGAVEMKNNGNYFITNPEKFSLRYRLKIDPLNIPYHPNGAHMEISKDDYGNKNGEIVKGTNLVKDIGMGAYWIKITYKDGTIDQIKNAYDIMKGKLSGDVISLLECSDLNSNASGISKIELTIVYELVVKLGPLDFNNQHTNWRSDYVFIFY